MNYLKRLKSRLLRPYNWQINALSLTGNWRDHNEDCVGSSACENAVLAVLADGVGGQNAGEVAANFVCERLKSWFAEAPVLSGRIADLTGKLRVAIHHVHAELYRQSLVIPEQKDMATTLALVLCCQKQAIAAWAGDSRIYLYRAGVLQQVSQDHSFVEEKVQQGVLTRAEAENHPMAHLITSCLGGTAILPRLDMTVLDLQPEDEMLLVSDGVSGVLTAEQIAGFLPQGAEMLVNAAISADSRDNCSAITVKVCGK